ncbi:PIN domain-containing protein [Sphingomonas sp.]|uniref:PIN domain-containing protein n=1 Tax=Sphingomonas sp. TaxID=28214 RepID=UPI001B285269|nr:PIN domain-containing protein [Sphingomonas sp.]MBO9713952.1 PIN domain-containing protein [Sphingomonas sp.]
MFLLDTPVVFELRKARAGRTDAGLARWAAGVARTRLFLSALSLVELENAAARIGKRDREAVAPLRSWIDQQLIPAFDGRILPIDAAVARRRAAMSQAESRNALLAATAIEHGLTLVTRDVAAFKGGRVKLFNPWGYTPDAAEDEDEEWDRAGRAGPLWLRNLFVRA